MKYQNTDQDIKFYELYTELVSSMTSIESVDITHIEALLIELSKLLRLSKGVTRLYRNPQEEAAGGGETLCCFDTGIEGNVVHSLRVVTSVMSIATLTVYMAPDEPPLSEFEMGKLDLVMRTTLSFVSRNRLRDIVEELAYYDDNGYRNFRSLNYYIMEQASLGSLSGKAVVRYNLMHFALVNKQIGRSLGDKVLRQHFEGLEELISGDGILGRLGGDNFILICSKEKLPEAIEYLKGTNIEYEASTHSSVRISASAGIYIVPENKDFAMATDVFEYSFAASRVAQSGERESIIYFDESLLSEKEKGLKIQQLFENALKTDEFHVFYQPKVNVHTGEISGAEALCRWIHNGKLVQPREFIPVLERSNDICLLDFYMLDHVCRDIRRWIDEGRRAVRVSVNLSRKHMMDVNLLNTIIGIIDKHNVPHGCIEIELTETTTDVEFKDLKRVVGGLQKADIFTSVDDFGIGYSSLNLIRVIPWNVLKVDRSFLPADADDKNSHNSIMFMYVVAMAKALGLECIVEGVETKAQLSILRENHCDLAQGYLFDRPLPVEDFEDRLNKRFYQITAD